jgi:hypothetical protein
MNDYYTSTLFPVSNQPDNMSTMKSISSPVLPGENTNATMGISVLQLPKENLEKVIKQDKKVEINDEKVTKPV